MEAAPSSGREVRPQASDQCSATSTAAPGCWVDELTLALARQRHEAVAAWGYWLAGFRWDLYAVLSFAAAPSPAAAERAVHRWLEVLQADFPRLSAFVSYDRGKATSRLNVHVLISGLLGKSRRSAASLSAHQKQLTLERAITLARRAWTRGQVCKIEPYDVHRGAPDYIARYANQGDLVGEFFGHPVRKRKQRHRRPREQQQP